MVRCSSEQVKRIGIFRNQLKETNSRRNGQPPIAHPYESLMAPIHLNIIELPTCLSKTLNEKMKTM